MYVRLKRIGSRRYAYLVEGVSENRRVRQKTLAYLGPVVKIASGVPDETRERVEQKVGSVDWNKVNLALQKIPLEFEELEAIKRTMLPRILARRRSRLEEAGRGSRPRVEGELSSLILMARKGFNEMFRTLRDGTLVMR